MTKYNTGNPIGSTAVKDLYDNAENLDVLVNDKTKESHPDRLGVPRKTWHGMEQDFNADQTERASEFDADQLYRENEFIASQEDKQNRFNNFIASSGYQFLGDYAAGIEITEYNQIIRDADGEFWRVSGQVELPYTTTGAGLPEGDALTPLGDAVLRQELANPDKGAAMVARGVVSVDSIADLLALPESTRREDLRYLVKGYLIGSDTGGGEFYWDRDSVEEEDGGVVLGSYPEGRWKRLISGPLQASWWNPEPGGPDSWAALQAALDAAGRLLIDLEIESDMQAYRISKPLVVKGRAFWFPEIRGVGGRVLIEKTTDATTGLPGIYAPDGIEKNSDVNAVMVVPALVNQPKFVSIKGLQLRGFEDNIPDYGLWVTVSENAHFEDLVATNVGIGFYDAGSWLITWFNCLARQVTVGGFRKQEGTSGRFEGCYVDFSDGYGFNVSSGYTGIHSSACDVVHGVPYVIRTSTTDLQNNVVVIDNCGQEYGGSDSVIKIEGGKAVSLTVRGTSFFNALGYVPAITTLPKHLLDLTDTGGYCSISLEDIRFVGITEGMINDYLGAPSTIVLKNVGTSVPEQNNIGTLASNTRVIRTNDQGLTVFRGFDNEFVRVNADDIVDHLSSVKTHVKIRNGQYLARGAVSVYRETGKSYGEATITFPYAVPQGRALSVNLVANGVAMTTHKLIASSEHDQNGATIYVQSVNDSTSWDNVVAEWILYGATS